MIQNLTRTTVALAVALLFSVAACSDDSDPGAPSNITGTYPLRSVNGDEIPAILIDLGTAYKLELLSGNLIINAGSTFSETLTYRETEDGAATTETFTCTGTYTRNGNSISLVEAESGDDCGGTFTGTISGGTITVAYDAELQAVYRK
jgi:hypothetical protein